MKPTPCYDCGSTIPSHHTPLCDMAEANAIRDLPQVPGTQYWARKERAPKRLPHARCCWICGREGGAGFTTALRILGYNVAKGDVAYAHPNCIAREQRKQRGAK